MSYLQMAKRSRYATYCQHMRRACVHVRKLRMRRLQDLMANRLRLCIRCRLRFRRIFIPALSVDLWDQIARISLRRTRVVLRSVCKDMHSIPLQISSPMRCALCSKDPFVPVQLRFSWTDPSKQWCESNIPSIFCVRCARAWVSVGMDKGQLKCANGCCNVPVRRNEVLWHRGVDIVHTIHDGNTRFVQIMGYGTWPRSKASLPHPQKYQYMDHVGIGQLQCPLCNETCRSVSDAANHLRGICRQATQQKDALKALVLTKWPGLR